MVAFNYSKITAKVTGVLKKFGRPCVLLRMVEATPSDPSKPWRVAEGTAKQYPFTGVVDFNSSVRGRTEDQGDGIAYIPSDLGVEPLETDRLKIIGNVAGETDPEYAIIGIRRVDPGTGGAIMYAVRFRGYTEPEGTV